jgi:hypothetical protein
MKAYLIPLILLGLIVFFAALVEKHEALEKRVGELEANIHQLDSAILGDKKAIVAVHLKKLRRITYYFHSL